MASVYSTFQHRYQTDAMADLGVWLSEDGCDWAIASSPEEATAMLCEHLGERPDDYVDLRWRRLDDAAPLTMNCDADGDPCDVDEGAPLTKTCGEWAKRGRGFLCTTNA